MCDSILPALPVVSPRILATIFEVPDLARNLFPEGLTTSPYEVMEYDATLDMEDPHGMRATFTRTQKIRFLHDGVSAVLDHFWGDGITVGSYSTDAGMIERTLTDSRRRHVVLRLKRPMRRGEELTFSVTRTVFAGFTNEHEWLSTQVDHPVHRLKRTILFPIKRACRTAVLLGPGGQLPIHPQIRADGRAELKFEVLDAGSSTPYVLVWHW